MALPESEVRKFIYYFNRPDLTTVKRLNHEIIKHMAAYAIRLDKFPLLKEI